MGKAHEALKIALFGSPPRMGNKNMGYCDGLQLYDMLVSAVFSLNSVASHSSSHTSPR